MGERKRYREREKKRERERIGNQSKTCEAFTLDFALESNLYPAGEATMSKNQRALVLLTPYCHTCSAQPGVIYDL